MTLLIVSIYGFGVQKGTAIFPFESCVAVDIRDYESVSLREGRPLLESGYPSTKTTERPYVPIKSETNFPPSLMSYIGRRGEREMTERTDIEENCADDHRKATHTT